MAQQEQQTLTVRSVRRDHKIAFWEKHPRHPGGEAIVHGDGKAVQIGQTPFAREAIGNGQILVMPSPEPGGTDVNDGDDASAASADPTVYTDDTETMPGPDEEGRPYEDAGKDKDARPGQPAASTRKTIRRS